MDPKALALSKINVAVAAIDGVFAKADAEKRALTAAELAEVSRLEAEHETAKTELAAAEKAEADQLAARQRQDTRRKEASTPNPRKVPAGSGAPVATEPQFEKDPKKGFATPRHFLTSVIDAGRGIVSADDQQKLRFLTVGSDEARGNSDPAGGYLVPVGFIAELLQLRPNADPLGDRTRKIPMATPIVSLPARTDKDHTTSVSGGVTFTRRPETVSGSASQMTLEKVTLAATEIFGLSYASEELLTDSPISFAALLEAGFQDQRTYHMTKERLFGTGVGEYLGMLAASNPCLVSVSKETGQAATTFVYENAIKMRARCWGYGDSIWLANYDTMPSFALMNQAVGTGGVTVFQPSAREDVPDMFFGRPLIFTEYCKTLGTAGDVALVNPTQYLEGIYQPLQSAESMHVRFVNHERTFKFWERNAGWPWWKTALTPANSTNTLSPFVVCATR